MGFNLQQLETEINKISDRHIPQQLSIHLYDTIPSTNQMLWELLDRNIKPPIAAIATQQTAGRGQWGRQWESQAGGLYLSVAININIPASNAPHLTLFSAWGIANVLRSYQIPVSLKWPNDLILEKRKLGGIKSETRIQQEKIVQAVIGVGINWTNPVPEVGINLQSLSSNEIASLEQLAAIAIEGICSGYQYYLTKGIETLLPSYLDFLNLGGKVTVNGCPGVVVGVNSQGELRVQLQSSGASTEIHLPSGTISLGYEV
ncbi:biotin--[acetyl-CoA-carboxylase] ligase [Candidatus Gracilibacteria bacterium]|nr:biotin--[acetyl-CoA-carboxylase] ligase [Candidatus Gracilibacteria bacterium]NJM89914.1 biotin--[acetyl-CoA-carboxylase] ligase [Hydrococcus sp. RU_2_2]NJP21782.1 biotin--[acetyl-CoA-carboxylase] ligase [Hydrococcus sp. CRU_1_1]